VRMETDVPDPEAMPINKPDRRNKERSK